MSFLAMSTWQAVGVVVLTAAAIVGLYLLKSPPRRILVSSTMLWSRVLKSERRRSDRLRWWLSLLLALAIGIALALALARPEWGGRSGVARRVAIIIDSSPSMLTLRSDGRTRWEHARDEARGLLRAGRPSGGFLVADTSGQVTTPAFEDLERALGRLEALRPSMRTELETPELAVGDAELSFVSDGVMIDPDRISTDPNIVSVFELADNVGITRLEPRPLPAHPSHYEAYLEVRNHSGTTKNTVLRVSGAGSQGARREVELEPGETKGEIFDLGSFRRGPIRASVTAGGDSLDADNFAYSYLPIPSKKRVLLVSSGNAYLETLLELDPNVELERSTPEAYTGGTAADVTLFDRCAPEAPPNRPYVLFRPPRRGWLPVEDEEIVQPEIGTWDRSHRVLENVALEDLVVDRAVRARDTEAQRLAGSPADPLILAGTEPTKWLLLTFALEDSNLPLLPGFPILLSNALSWLSGDPIVVARSAGTVEISIPSAVVTTLEGTRVPSYGMEERTYFETDEPGLYLAANDKERLHVAVNLNGDNAVDPNRTHFSEDDSRDTSPRREASSGRWAWSQVWIGLLLLAVGLLMLEWWSYHRRWTI
jgi:hypothetical protein